jgi:pantothenate kinase-related protein Tda10
MEENARKGLASTHKMMMMRNVLDKVKGNSFVFILRFLKKS